jgi:hypothetical protein
LFKADLTLVSPQVPQTLAYQNIFNSFDIDEGNCLIISEGIKKMLVMFIYFHYVRDMFYINTTTGVVSNVNENTTAASYNGYNLVEAFNKGINTYDAVQWYVERNNADYLVYNGQYLEVISGI